MSRNNSRPLEGKRVLVTRSREQSQELICYLEASGATVLVWPAIEIVPPDDWTLVDATLARIDTFDWLVFTSANGVRGMCGRMLSIGRDVASLAALKIAAVGPATVAALRTFQLDAELMPGRYRSDDLEAALMDCASGRRILFARADRGRSWFTSPLRAVADISEVIVYRQKDAAAIDVEVYDAIHRGEVDYVTITSGNIARSFLRLLDETGRVLIRSGKLKLVSISPITSEAIAAMGYEAGLEAGESTMAGIVSLLIAHNQGAR